ncbi:MAG: T9SS type A sorting domain-containing protein [Rhodothermales bacterium]|nr:T9SS type A sorting domain-containing protein [Rhodothermales bacterium]
MPDRFSHILLGLVLSLAVSQTASAQIPPPPPDCQQGTAMASIRGPSHSGPVYNTGSLFWRDASSPQGFEDLEGRSQLLAASLWIAARFENTLSMAGSMLGPWEFWPGPLDENGLTVLDCQRYDRIYSIARADILAYERDGSITRDLADWPAWAGAPVADGDGDPDNYDLAGGDRPALLGDRMLWWVMNDRGGPHVVTDGSPLPVQVEVSAFTFNVPGVLGRSTFFKYRIKRFGLLPLTDARVGLFVYAGLGNVLDDYVGADTLAQMGYVYNADAFDEGGYGATPPAVGIGILRGAGLDLENPLSRPRAIAEHEMGSFIAFQSECDGAFPECNPYPFGRGPGYYNMMQGLRPWGEPIVVSSSGFGGPVTTPIMYTGTPPEFWSEGNVDGSGTAAPPGDRKMVVSTGSFTMVPGEIQEVVFAIVSSTGDDHLDSVRQLREDMSFVREQTALILTPSGPGRAEPDPVVPLALSGPWPNPANEEAWLDLSLPEPMETRVEVYDLLGRRVGVAANGLFEEGRHLIRIPTADLTPGVYGYRVKTGRFSASGAILIAR